MEAGESRRQDIKEAGYQEGGISRRQDIKKAGYQGKRKAGMDWEFLITFLGWIGGG
jgi:hypothetical protein